MIDVYYDRRIDHTWEESSVWIRVTGIEKEIPDTWTKHAVHSLNLGETYYVHAVEERRWKRTFPTCHDLFQFMFTYGYSLHTHFDAVLPQYSHLYIKKEDNS